MILATKANMHRYEAPGVFAYSLETGEECSANPGDYWWMTDDDDLVDADGNTMVLAVHTSGVLLLDEVAS